MRRFVVLAMSEVFIVGVVAAVTDDSGRVLLLEHSYRPRGPWGFPAGNVKRGESFEQAVRREFQEETGRTLERTRLVAAYQWRRPPEVLLVYRGVLGAGEFHAGPEITACRFVPLTDLLATVGRSSLPVARVVLQLLREEATARSVRVDGG